MGKFKEIKLESLKDKFIQKLEDMIISGELEIGEQLPPERNLALDMGVSRSIVNTGLAELAINGFVKIIPRRGTFIADYRENGTINALNSVMRYNNGKVSRDIFYSMMDTRIQIECSSAKKLAVNITDEELNHLETQLKVMKTSKKTEDIAEANFEFHHLITNYSGNIVNALILKSCKEMIKAFIMQFALHNKDSKHILLYENLLEHFKNKDGESAYSTMHHILEDGSNVLEKVVIID